MSVSELLLDINQATLDNLLPLTKVNSEKDIERYKAKGYTVGMTAEEFHERYPLLPVENIYCPLDPLGSLMYCELDNPRIPILLNLQIFGEDRLQMNNEDDKTFQKKTLSLAKKIAGLEDQRLVGYMAGLGDSLRLSVLAAYIERNDPSPEMYSVFLGMYQSTDFGFSQLPSELVRKALSGKSREQHEETRIHLTGLSEEVVIYRGEGSESTPYTKAYSWTTSRQIAMYFACRIPSADDSRILKAKVKRMDILERLQDKEQEIIVFPESVYEVEETVLYGVVSLEEAVDDIQFFYQRYRRKIKELYRGKQRGEAHNAEHTLRVLFDALLIVRQANIWLSLKQYEQLCTAIVYHDIGRTTDDVCAAHGKASAKIYHDSVEKPDPVVEFLIAYHSVDDDVSEQFLREQLFENPERVLLLYSILKDADALDRARFGLQAVDPDYFRIKQSIQILPTAQMAIGHLLL